MELTIEDIEWIKLKRYFECKQRVALVDVWIDDHRKKIVAQIIFRIRNEWVDINLKELEEFGGYRIFKIIPLDGEHMEIWIEKDLPDEVEVE